MYFRHSYVKGLDGMRALCALFILFGHICQKDFGDWGGREIMTIPLPECCVDVFFVISGLLAGFRMETITSVSCYMRKKALRLLPLYYSYIVITILVYLVLGKASVIWDGRLLYYLLLIPEIPFCSAEGILPLVHLWFIEVLALFYMVIPFLTKVTNNASRNTIVWIIALLWFLLKIFSYLVFGKNTFFYRFCSTVSFDILFMAVYFGIKMKERRFLHIKDGSFLLNLIVWILFFGSGFYGRFVPAPIRPEFISGLAILFVLGQQSSHPVISLENKFFRWLGGISYEVYVVQILVIILLAQLYSAADIYLSDLIIYLICVIVVVVCAWLMKVMLSFLLNPQMKRARL